MKKLLKSSVCGSREQCMDALFTQKVDIHGLKKKKNKLKTQMQNTNHLDPNATLVSDYYYYVNSSKVFTNENDTN